MGTGLAGGGTDLLVVLDLSALPLKCLAGVAVPIWGLWQDGKGWTVCFAVPKEKNELFHPLCGDECHLASSK